MVSGGLYQTASHSTCEGIARTDTSLNVLAMLLDSSNICRSVVSECKRLDKSQ